MRFVVGEEGFEAVGVGEGAQGEGGVGEEEEGVEGGGVIGGVGIVVVVVGGGVGCGGVIGVVWWVLIGAFLDAWWWVVGHTVCRGVQPVSRIL